MIKLILALFMSFSIRTANIQPNPEDYEIAVGYSGQSSNLSLEWERQNGVGYFNYELKSPRYSYLDYDLGLDLVSNSAKQVDRQTVSLVRIFNGFNAGFAVETCKWSSFQPAVTVGFKNGFNELLMRVAVNRFYLQYKIGQRFPFREKFFIEPFYKITITELTANWQGKILVGTTLEF